MKIGPAVRPRRRIEKKGKDRTGQPGQDSLKKSQSVNISPIWGEAPTVPIETKICVERYLADLSHLQSFKMKFSGVTILQGVEFPIFLLIFALALQHAAQSSAACDNRDDSS